MSAFETIERHRLFLNPYADEPFTQCPSCGTATHTRTRVLLVHVKPDLVGPVAVQGRLCPNCDLLIVQRDELLTALQGQKMLKSREVAPEHLIVLGTLDRAQIGRIPLEELSMEDAMHAFRPFAEYVHFERVGKGKRARYEERKLPSPLERMEQLPVPGLEELQQLPRVDELWEVGVRQVPTWIVGEEGKPYRPYMILIMSAAGPWMVFQQLTPTRPTPEEVRDALWKAMISPAMGAGDPRRPKVVHTDDEELAAVLRPDLEKLGIPCRVQAVEWVDDAFEDLSEFIAGETEEAQMPGLLDTPGVTPELVGELFEAAAAFYRMAPWRWLYNEDIIVIRYPLPDGPWRYVSVMGNAGMEFGLAVFERLEDYTRLATLTPGTAVGQMTYRSLTFDDATVLPSADLDAIERYGWEVADERAYPLPFILTPEEQVLRPGPEELEWYIVTLRAIMAFMKEYWPEEEDMEPEPTAVIFDVPLRGSKVQVELRYPSDVVTEEDLEELEQQVYRFSVRRGRRGRKKYIEVLGSQTLAELDAILRDAYGYDVFDHLSGFWLVGERGEPDIELGEIEPFGGGEAADVLIGFLELEPGKRLHYVYDFGDWIEHTITLEAVTERREGVDYPRLVS